MPDDFEPRIVAFFCNWCTYLAADLAGTSRIKYLPNAEVVRVMCSGRVDVQFVLKAFAKGADGVLIGGCHPGDCHYQEGNYIRPCAVYRLLRRLAEARWESKTSGCAWSGFRRPRETACGWSLTRWSRR
jgi:F420-non-reducing hydrogenase iron-sulfur subunit